MKLCAKPFLVMVIALMGIYPVGASLNLENGISATIGGSDSVEGISTPDGQSVQATGSIQAAVDSANEGAKIHLMAKTYYEHVEVPKSLEIVGKGSTKTIVDGQQAGPVFAIGSDANRNLDVKLSKMTITNGHGSNVEPYRTVGGGILNYGSLTLNNIVITENFAENGGGIGNFGALTTKDTSIYLNYGWIPVENGYQYGSGGGIYNFASGTMVMDRGSVSDNHAGWGGGIENAGLLTLNRVSISKNTAIHFGGGIQNGGLLTINDGSIFGNSAGSGGGIDNLGSLTINGGSIFDNSATTYYGYGGGIDNYGTLNLKQGSSITDNTAAYGGGGIFDSLDHGTVTFRDSDNNIIPGYDPTNNDYLYFFGPTINGPDNTPEDFLRG